MNGNIPESFRQTKLGHFKINPATEVGSRPAPIWPTEAALLASKLLFDIFVYGLGEVVLRSSDRVSLLQNIHLD